MYGLEECYIRRMYLLSIAKLKYVYKKLLFLLCHDCIVTDMLYLEL